MELNVLKQSRNAPLKLNRNVLLNRLKRIYRPGVHYQKAGALLPDLWSEGVVQASMFDIGESSDRCLSAVDVGLGQHQPQAR
jgi:hypothetical protein